MPKTRYHPEDYISKLKEADTPINQAKRLLKRSGSSVSAMLPNLAGVRNTVGGRRSRT